MADAKITLHALVTEFLPPSLPAETASHAALSELCPDGKRNKAAAAWKLARALRARYPGRLRVVEAGMWAESSHVLVFCDTRRATAEAEAGEPLAMLEVGGSLHLIARADGRPLLAGISPVLSIVPWGWLCDGGRGGESNRQDRRRARTLTVTAMAAALGL